MGAEAPNVAVFSSSIKPSISWAGERSVRLMGTAMDQVHEGYLKASLGAGSGQLRFLQIAKLFMGLEMMDMVYSLTCAYAEH